jgi:hypothetical protein
MFPINAADQEKFIITNVLKKPHRVSVHQLVRHVEQLNAYIVQMPCFYNSLSANISTMMENLPFMEAELGSHVLRICPLQWQDQYNLHEKACCHWTCVCSLSLLRLLREYVPRRTSMQNPARKLPPRARKATSNLVPNQQPEFPRKLAPRSIAPMQEAWGCRHYTQYTRLL